MHFSRNLISFKVRRKLTRKKARKIKRQNTPIMPPTLIDLSANKHAIEKSNIATKTRYNYNTTLIRFTIFCFERTDFQDLIHEDFINLLKEAKRKDLEEPRYKKRQQYYLRAEILAILRKLKRGNSALSPIRLVPTEVSDRVLTYDDIVSFMETFKKTEKVNKRLANQYLKQVRDLSPEENEDLEDALILTGGLEDDGEILVEIRQEYTTYDGIRSAITQLYTATATTMPDQLKESMRLYIKGSKRLNNLAKQTLGLDMGEGKKPMTRAVYKRICQILSRSEQSEHIFAHLFFVLDW